MAKVMMILATAVQSGLTREGPGDVSEGKVDVGTYDFEIYFNWNYLWVLVAPITVLICCLRRYCCSGLLRLAVSRDGPG